MRIVYGLAACLLVAGAGTSSLPFAEAPAMAQRADLSAAGFQAYLPQLRAEAERAGIRRETFDRIFPTLTFSARTVQLDRNQPGGTPGIAPSGSNPPFAPFRARHITQAADRPRPRSLSPPTCRSCASSAAATACPPSIMIAIWGKETGYGSIMGDFDLLNSLASLAYEGRRRQLFTDEFIATCG